MATFSNRFKSEREKRGWSQEVMAEKLGLTRSAIAGYESASKNRLPRRKTLDSIAKIFDVNTDYLLGRTDDPRPIHDRDQHLPPLTSEEIEDISKMQVAVEHALETGEPLLFEGKKVSRAKLATLKAIFESWKDE